ncbi:hypothetical protein TspCOW1_23460 [Thiohalobacter sp. COW1]|uniref:Uncharacterized protein n=1 Tax=Thiohalobacter thiocyanaticus TaxID=585455 RepID=A0A1Z4VMH2_9GAMM|nr:MULTISPECIES: hypothetical protein [Thiohalobacter]BAZ92797.1 uncharacterized protein FOKN1_0393 [Thiohalobacter thiocyanaticus]BCO32243.1 hypothetical protein TspCOW1_23460 [Thiohalobacter sp. COW1]
MSNEIPLVQRVISILWPSFLTSSLATILFFTAFDPLYLLAGTALAELSRMGAYTLGFFLFWGLTTLTSGLTCYFSQPCDENRRRTRGGHDDGLSSAL